ncbi:MAG: FGGY-family carbohydrate kinase [Lachnospiraceae bacterium]|jgi:sugar (pentulose or hexulose) kinase|nr:FGGY-family carbohydrate kinase [Lachnospiraceae bacterium]
MYVIGVDVGTTGAKALLVDQEGRVCSRGYQGYGTVAGPGGAVEQRAEVWWEAAALAVRQAGWGIEKRDIKALSLSTQGASSVLVDGDFHTLGNAITWMDMRAVREMEELRARREEGYYYRTTGWEISPNLDACKLAWLKANRPKEMGRASKFLSTLEYMNYCLTGNYVTDPTNAAMRQMMDVHTQKWDEKILEDIGAGEELLPQIRPAGAYIGTLTVEAARVLGLSGDTRVYNGAHDQYCCALGSGSVENGDLLLGTGTAWAVMSITDAPLVSESKISFAKHVVPELWGALTSVSFGGVSLDWFKDRVAGCAYEELADGVRTRMGTEEKLLFFPYFNGAAGPVRDEKLRGTFTGLELGHDRFHMAAAVMEGVVFHTAMVLEDYQKNGALLRKLRVMGGALNSREWMEMMKAVFDCEIQSVVQKDAAALGAAMIAAVGSGLFGDYRQAAEGMVSLETEEEAPQKLRAFYRRKLEVYRERWSRVQMIYREGE